MKTKLFVFLFLAGNIIPSLLFAQFTQQGPKIVGTGAVGNAYQGVSAAVSSDGNTAIIGGYYDNASTGAVWVFTRSGDVWTQQGPKLVGTGAIFGRVGLGFSVALSSDGNTAVVGGPYDNGDKGAAWVFIRSGGIWTQQGSKLVGTGAVGNAYQSNSVAISSDGNTAVVGGPGDDSGKGAVGIYPERWGLDTARSKACWNRSGWKCPTRGFSCYFFRW